MYSTTNPSIWSGRVDELDGELGNRWHQVIQIIDLKNSLSTAPSGNHIALLGFECDEGVRRNRGRVGAALAPMAIRQCMVNFPVHFDTKKNIIYDAGNVSCTDGNLDAAQIELALIVSLLQSKGYKTIVIGGGHETAYGHFLGLHQYFNSVSQSIGIINLDAHFDLRHYDSQGSSGTPFLQAAEYLAKHNEPFHYMALGIEKAGNTQALYRTASDLRVNWLHNDDLESMEVSKLHHYIQSFCSKVDHVYLTLDMDVVAMSSAPGVSAVAPFGLQPIKVKELMNIIYKSGKVASFDVVETNPVHDIDNMTAKLAARFVYEAVGLIDFR
jgi:formiminoglutamase